MTYTTHPDPVNDLQSELGAKEGACFQQDLSAHHAAELKQSPASIASGFQLHAYTKRPDACLRKCFVMNSGLLDTLQTAVLQHRC